MAVADVRLERAEKLAADLGGQAIAVEMDVTTEQSVVAAVREVTERLGPLDILVATAGYGEKVPFAEMDYSQWRAMLATHPDGTFLAMRHTLPGMLERGWGRIITFSSIAASQGVALQSHYAAAKGAIDALVRSVAHEVIPGGVTVNAIAPGYFESPLNDGASPERLAALRASMPAGRFGDPSEMGRWSPTLLLRRRAICQGRSSVRTAASTTAFTRATRRPMRLVNVRHDGSPTRASSRRTDRFVHRAVGIPLYRRSP